MKLELLNAPVDINKLSKPEIRLLRRFKKLGVDRSDLNKDQWQLFFECRYRLLVVWVKIGEFGDKEIRAKKVRLLEPA